MLADFSAGQGDGAFLVSLLRPLADDEFPDIDESGDISLVYVGRHAGLAWPRLPPACWANTTNETAGGVAGS